MNLQETLKVIKSGKGGELKKAKMALKSVFADKFKRKKAFQEIIESISEYEEINNERNKLAFIFSLKLVAKEKGENYFPLFIEFIIDYIQSDSDIIRIEIVRLTNILLNSLIVDDGKLTESQKKIFNKFVDKILLLLEVYYDPKYDGYEDISDIPASKYKSLKMLIEKLMNPGIGKEGVKKKAGIPNWMDCMWKRIPCMSDNCPVCNHIKQMKEVPSFFERRELFIESMDKSQRNRENLPNPSEFSFYRELEAWIESILKTAEKSKIAGDFWIFTEEAADLFWYTNILSIKAYRQLCNRHLISNNNKENSLKDYRYTNYVLEESVKIIKKSLKNILTSNPEQAKEIKDEFKSLSQIEEKLLNI